MSKHLITSRALSQQEMQTAISAGGSTSIVGKRPTGRQGKIRTATVNLTSQKRKS